MAEKSTPGGLEMDKDFYALYPVGGMNVEVHVTKERRIFGRSEYLIAPSKGNGQIWVSSKSLVDDLNEDEDI